MAEPVKPECCSVCLDNFIKLQIFDCNHGFCEACLEDVVHKSVEDNKFPCPLCRVIITIPSNGTSGFPENTANNEDGASRYPASSEEKVKPTDGTSGFPENTANNELGASSYPTSSEEVKPADAEESEDDQLKCVVCTNDVNAEFECIECDKLMCNACKTSHDLFLTSHHVRSVTENTLLCGENEGEKLEYFGLDCNEPVCRVCRDPKHTDHDTSTIEDYGAVVKQELVGIKEEMCNYVTTMNRTLIQAEELIALKGNNIDQIVAEFTRFIEEFKYDFSLLHTREETNITNDKQFLKRLNIASKCISNAVATNTYINLLAMVPEMKTLCNDMKAYMPHFNCSQLDPVFTQELSHVSPGRSFKFTFENSGKSTTFIVGGIHWQIEYHRYFDPREVQFKLSAFLEKEDTYKQDRSCTADVTFKFKYNDESVFHLETFYEHKFEPHSLYDNSTSLTWRGAHKNLCNLTIEVIISNINRTILKKN